jgi:hypothetical protein
LEEKSTEKGKGIGRRGRLVVSVWYSGFRKEKGWWTSGKQGFRYEKECLSKKEETTCIGNGNSGENPNRFNVKRARKTVTRTVCQELSSFACLRKATITLQISFGPFKWFAATIKNLLLRAPNKQTSVSPRRTPKSSACGISLENPTINRGCFGSSGANLPRVFLFKMKL